MSVFLTVLKVIGIILLVILALILLILSLVLFVPFTYGVKGSYHEKDPEGEARFSWLFRGVSVKVEFRDKKLDVYAKILGLFKIGILDRIKGKKEDGEDAAADDEAVPEVKEEKPAAPSQEIPQEKPEEKETDEKPAAMETTADADEAAVHQEAPEDAGTEAPEENIPEEADSEATAVDRIREKAAGLIRKIKDLYYEKKQKVDEKLADLEDKKKFLTRDRVKAAIAHVLKMVFRMLKHIMPKKLSGKAELGLASPAATGRVLAILSATMPLHKNKVRILPDFEHEHIDADGKITGRIFVIVLLVYAVRIILNRNVLYVLKNYKKHFS